MFESRISAGAMEKLPVSEKSESKISSWSYDMEGHAKKCVERYCELANTTTQQLHKVATPCCDDHQFKEEETGSVGELSTVCSQIVLKCLYLARIGRPDISWSVNKYARAVTIWTKACDKISVSHSSREADIISLDAGLRVEKNSRAWSLGVLWLKYFIPHQTKSTNPKVRSHRETCQGTPHSTCKNKIH